MDYLFCLFQEIILQIVDILFQITLYPKVNVNDFNVLINGKSFFDLPVKMMKKLMKKLLT